MERRWLKLWERNEDLLRSCADHFGCSGIESATDETADKRHHFNKVHNAPGARLRDEPETDGPIDPLQDFTRDPEDHLSCQLSPDINAKVLQNIEGGRTGETGKHQRPDLIASDIVTSQVSNGSDHADLDVQHAGEVGRDGNRQSQYAADTCDEPCGACLGDLPGDEAIYGIVYPVMLRAVALCQIFHTLDAWDPS